ncbi:MAG: ExbD/TolR family protein [Thioalkalivibrionaceae bacterium]
MKFSSARRDEVELSLTPLIDVVFLLLIFFMVSTTFDRVAELELKLPEASQGDVRERDAPIELWLSADGRLFVDGDELINRRTETLERHLRRAYSLGSDEEASRRAVILRADAKAEHQWVVSIIDTLSRLGVGALSIATRQDFADGLTTDEPNPMGDFSDDPARDSVLDP